MAMGRMWQLPAWLALFCGLSTATFRGKEFFTVFLQNDAEGTHADIRLLLTGYFNSTKVTVRMHGGTFTTAVTVGEDQTVSLRIPSNAELVGSQLLDKAILIQSTKEISVVYVSYKSYTVGATAVLPVDKLGNKYYVVTPGSTTTEGLSEFAVAAGKTSATVSINVKGKFYYSGRNYSPGSTLHISLNPYQSFQLQSIYDLSGTKITSDNAILVLSGHSCVKINTGCDYVVEQLLPVSLWGKAYVVPPNPLQTYTDFAYVVADEKASITYTRNNVATTEDVLPGQVLKFEMSQNLPLSLSASAAIQVLYFFTGASKKDPFLLNIPPISSYCTSYRVSSLDDYENHVVLIARNVDTSTTTLNKKTKRTMSWKAIPGTEFSWATVTMSKPSEIQTAEHQQTPLGLLVFGFQHYAGYGFTGLCATSSSSPFFDYLEWEEECGIADGQSTCIHETFSTCWATGDPHYQTFDGKHFDLMGTCTYTLTKTCDSDPTLPVFSVEAKNEHRGNPKVSYIGSVTVRVYDITIVVVRSENGIVRVNNHCSRLPISLAQGKLHLQQKGTSVLIETNFSLKILYNWDDHVMVKLPSRLSGTVCGMCGNSNGDSQDDALMPDGNLAQDAVSLGQSWKVAHEGHRCWDSCSGECGRCQWGEAVKYKGETSCGLLTQRPGPFEHCHATIDPKIYLKNCVYDVCVNNGLHAKLCQALKAYADACQEEGVTISDWRTLARCPLSCPKNSNYTICGTACPATCNNDALPAHCDASTCVETCKCQEGFIFDANKCIPKDECGCVFDGLLHGLHEEFWGDNTCTKRCVCDAKSQKAVCRLAGCRAGEECRVEEGIQDCYPKSYGTCTAVGGTHYESFDGGKFIFQGTCMYQFAGLCKKNQGLVDFQVLVQNGRQDDKPLSSIAVVTIKVYGKIIVISQEHPGKITIDDRLVNLPYQHRDKKISIYRGGQEAVVETNFGLTVTYDWRSQVTVSAPSTYANALCGLCGNYNGNVGDEMMMKNGQRTSNPDALGHSWKVTDIPGCVELSQVECPAITAALRHQEVTKMGCKIISQVEGPFRACHAHVDAIKYFQNCVHDFCLFPDQEDVVCQVIARYTAACQAVGVNIGKWRTDNFCSISCPANSHYEICSQDCSQTCSSIYAPMKCSERCREGCVCNEGFVLSGDECVPISRCGCLHQDFYYKAEEIFFPTKQEKCQCKAGGIVECQKVSCPGGSEGKEIDGVFQCPPATLGVCVATGDRNYFSFDGVAFNISGTCSYVLTETCASDSVKPFVVKIEKTARQKRKVSGIQALSVEVYGFTLTLRRGKRGTVMVDSISHHLPVILSNGKVQVYQHGMGVLLQTDFGLIIRYDLLHHVTVTVPQSYQGHLCGLCGNYNGQRNDDFLLPSGHQAPNMMVFGSAWKTPDVSCSNECSQDDCPICTEKKKVVLQKRNYCGILLEPKGPFESCHHLINPTLYYQACLHDVCLADGDTPVLCQSIQSYATSCQDAGVTIEAWRRPSFCPLSCPANSNYSLCTNFCVNSCTGLVDASKCPKKCVEGCSCNKGYFFDRQNCVPQDKCGCFVDGKYYKPYESILKDNCRQRCTCVPSTGVTCSSHSCTDDETCEIRDGVLGCINQNPCKALQCRAKERCKLKDGKAKCVPSQVATCWGWGDPHYHTFDGLDFDFQGTCTYTMVESCGNDTKLVPFKVEAKNDIRSGVKSVSYVSLANINVYGQHISIHRKEVGKVRVNGVLTLLPVRLEDDKVQIFQSGLSAVLETDFGLRVMYDWNWHLLIDLPSSYYKHTCGLCGNFNLKPEDDVPQSGSNLTALVAWAEGWKVPEDDDPFCWDYCEGTCPVCEEEKKELYGGNQYCGLIKKTFQGPFKACHDIIKPQDFYRNCLYDVCISEGAKKILCQVLEAYASTCKKHGAIVHDWRTPSGCLLPCPENSHYEACGNACPATCTNRDAPTACTQPCVETCACNEGYVLSGGQCVAVGSCGCTRDGRYYRPGEEFWADESCQSRCRCDPDLGMVVCKEDGCKTGEKCAVVKGVRRCVAKSHFICVATGDPHYTTFDGRRYDFMGTCVYQLAALCSSDPTLVPFNVTVENNNRGSRVVSYTKEVTLNVYNMSLSLSQAHPQKLKVDGILVDLPFNHGGKLHVYLSGIHGFIKTDFGVIVTFDWYSYARVILPVTYSQAVCGLCGNANNDPQDDFALPDGQQPTDEIQFANFWKVADVPGCWAGCTEGCKVCTETEKRAYRGDKHCGLLMKKQGPFAACHGTIDPTPYFNDCLFDVCLYKGHQETVCSSISAYVTACQSRGIRIKRWRTAAFCSLVCAPNQHYELCGPACPATCRGQTETEECEETAFCVEGCFCNEGFLLSGDRCVPLAQCGCLHEGRYYKLGEEFFACPRCSERCTCKGTGEVECRPDGCAADEACMVQDGVRGCYPQGCGRCQVLGAVSYSTFDGRPLYFAGTCTYTLAATKAVDAEKPVVPFAVEMEKASDKGGPVIRRLLVTVDGITIGMARGTQWEVTVDGERHLLPLTLAGGSVTVSQEGAHRVLQARGGPKLLYDGDAYVLLTLPDAYRRRVQGICGDFDGDAADDLTAPQELGTAWGTQTPSCTHGSSPPTCSSDDPGPCGVLADATGPFAGCHDAVEPREHVAACARERCGKAGVAAACRSLQAYAAACQAAGGQLQEWRAVAKCPLSCPSNSRYELCTRTCAHTCAGLSVSTQCTPRCFEGCRCDDGFLFNGDECVPMDSCGCLHRGRYFEIAETVLSSDCSQSCTCQAAGGMHCQPAGCPFGQTCGFKNNVRACVEQPGRCTLVPAARFVSFDGITGTTTATGIYVVTSLCDPRNAAWFRLLVDVGENRDRPVVVALHLFSGRAFVTVKRDKKVWVNGIPATFPVEVSSTLTITETKGTIWITQTPEFVIGLSPAGEVTVTVAKDLSKQLCGLCGNYDGNAANDLQGPDGKLVENVVAAAKAWRAPDFTH
ncbi:IgGFc-binding protein-like [Balearica regulorum gibbericeps]|uniref:IgGFc-binding protein-like n=1 Tax=Balearica regulorum gibbericeps TaxID=100784 RepID=UPI003F645730